MFKQLASPVFIIAVEQDAGKFFVRNGKVYWQCARRFKLADSLALQGFCVRKIAAIACK